jgi:hypothetical protein
MPTNTNGQNSLVDGLAAVVTHISLHNGDPGTTGVNELTGGSPAYARKAVTWAAAASGQRSNTAQLLFDVPAVATPGVAYLGFWSAITAGTFYGYTPAGNFTPMVATIDAATDAFTSFAHGLTNGQTVLVYDIMASGLSAGFTEGTIYFVVNATTDTFQLSATSGGAAITITTSMEVAVQRLLGEIYAAQGQYSIAASALVLDGRFV